MSKRKKLKIILALLIICLTMVIISNTMFNHFYEKMNVVETTHADYGQEQINNSPSKHEKTQIINKDSKHNSEINSEESIRALAEREAEPLINNDTVFNILLIGTDQRGDVAGTRSDTVMVASINQSAEEITLSSFMRDSYVKIPQHRDAKLNAAYAYGGADLLQQTLYNNFNLPVDKFVQVDFSAFITAFDELCPINVSISEQEKKAINECIDEINGLNNRPWGTNNIANAGENVELKNGEQALAYARIRKVGNSDFDRTMRQREILTKAFEKIKNMNIIQLNNLANKTLPLITTNLTKGECFSLMLNINKYRKYEIEEKRFPIDGSYNGAWRNKQQVLLIDFDKNIKEIKRDIYKEIAD